MAREDQIYEYIRREIERTGFPPTIREIGSRFGISSTNGVRYFLDRLEDRGLISRSRGKARGISLVESRPDSGVAIPLLGRVPAGEPSFSGDDPGESLVLDSSIAGGDGVFAVRVQGDSMTGAGIFDGDIAVVKRNPAPRGGQIVVALMDDEVTLKRLVKSRTGALLRPENPAYPDIDLADYGDKEIRILGVVQAIVRKY
jgi:repressor LexA